MSTIRPSVNWNKTGGVGVRTSLRGPRPSPIAQVTKADSTDYKPAQIVTGLDGNISSRATSVAADIESETHAERSVGEHGKQGDADADATSITSSTSDKQVPAESSKSKAKSHAEAEPTTVLDEDEVDSLYGTDSDGEEIKEKPTEIEADSDEDDLGLDDIEADTAAAAAAQLQVEPTGSRSISKIIHTDHGTSAESISSPGSIEDGEVLLNMTENNTVPPSVTESAPVQNTAPSTKKLQLTNVSRTTTEQDIRAFFNGYSLALVEIVQAFGRPTNEIFVHVNGISDAQRAVDDLAGKILNGRPLKVKFALDDTPQKSAFSSIVASAKASQSSSRTGSVLQFSADDERSPSDETGSESGELLDDSDEPQSMMAGSESGELEEDEDEEHEVIEIESDEDPMITDYADADRTHQPVDPQKLNNHVEIIDLEDDNAKDSSRPEIADLTTSGPQTLAELTPAQLEIQVRYFYVSCEPETISETSPVHCTICARVGHLAPWCPSQICKHCNRKGEHFSKHCPTMMRCPRCRGRHEIVNCTLKLKSKKLVLKCDFCKEIGHAEEDCELNWRSSGAIWKNKLPPLSIRRTCYNCGDSGHLGNDCRLRRPGKAMGTSAWSEKGLPSPFTPLTTSIDEPISTIPPSKKSQKRLPNAKAKGVSAATSKSSGSTKSSSSFLPVKKQPIKIPVNKIKGKAAPNIQIKGIAARNNLDAPGYQYVAPPQQSTQQRYDHNQSDRRYASDQNNFPRGRTGDGYRPRSRSRSRSPQRGWYQSAPRGYAPPPQSSSRDYRDRDDPRYSGGWRGR